MPRPRIHLPSDAGAAPDLVPSVTTPRDVRVHPLTGARAAALEALVRGMEAAAARNRQAVPEAQALPSPSDLLLERVAPGSALGTQLRGLAEGLLRSVLGREDAPPEEALASRTEQLAEVAASAAAEATPGGGPLPPGRRRALAEAEQLLREVALEVLDFDVGLDMRKGGGELGIGAGAVDAFSAHVRLLERLFDRLETSLVGQETLQAEREASGWWFMRWSNDPRPASASSQAVREQEWSLVERSTLFMGPVLDNFLRQGPAGRLPGRQRKLAEALVASFPGVFVVRERRGDLAVYQDSTTGRRLEVHEHNEALDYGAGALVMGRLYAFEGSLHLRSPGSILLSRADEELATALGEGFRRGRVQLAPAIALEAVLTAFSGNDRLPRNVLPARSAEDAKARVERATRALMAAGFVEESDAPREEGESPADPTPARRFRVDVTVGEWLAALYDQAQGKVQAAGAGGGKKPGKPAARARARAKGKGGRGGPGRGKG